MKAYRFRIESFDREGKPVEVWTRAIEHASRRLALGVLTTQLQNTFRGVYSKGLRVTWLA